MRLASISESEGSIDHVSDTAVQAVKATSAASVTPPQKRLRSGATMIAAAHSPAPSSVAQISTVVAAELQAALRTERSAGYGGGDEHRDRRVHPDAGKRDRPLRGRGANRDGG